MIKIIKSVNDFWNHLLHKENSEELPNGNSSLLVANSITAPDESKENSVEAVDTETKDGNEEIKEDEQKESTLDTLTSPSYDFIRKQTYIKYNESIILGASIRGRSHIESNTECQDYHLYQELSEGWSILVVSDGAGSAKHAGRGSKANCTISIKLLSEMIAKNKWIENSILPSELDWHIEFRTICERMKQIYPWRTYKK